MKFRAGAFGSHAPQTLQKVTTIRVQANAALFSCDNNGQIGAPLVPIEGHGDGMKGTEKHHQIGSLSTLG